MANSRPMPQPRRTCKHQARKIDRVKKQKRRPPTWIGHVQRQMIFLYLYTDLTNESMVTLLKAEDSEQSTREGRKESLTSSNPVRSMQTCRADLLINDPCWRPKNRSMMLTRLAMLRRYAQIKNRLEHMSWKREALMSLERQTNCVSSFQNHDKSVESGISALGPKVHFRLTSCCEEACTGEALITLTVETDTGQSQTFEYACADIHSFFDPSPSQNRGIWAHVPPLMTQVSVVMDSIPLSRVNQAARLQLTEATAHFAHQLMMTNCHLQNSDVLQFCRFPKLRILDLRHNRLSSLPKLPRSLVVLNISHNKFKFFPADIHNLTSLVMIDVSYNAVRFLPSYLGKLTRLRAVYTDGNAFDLYTSSLIDDVRMLRTNVCMIGEASYCVTAFTQGLKRRLHQLSGSDNRANIDPPQCTCAGTSPELADLPPDPTHSPQHQPDWTEWIRNSMIVPPSTRSTATFQTFDSLTSIRLSMLSLNLNDSWRDIMQKHCCNKRSSAGGQCLHINLCKWLEKGAPAPPPSEVTLDSDKGGNTALHFAALLKAPITALILLVQYGHDVCRRNTRGETFLHLVHAGFWQEPSFDLRRLLQLLEDRGFSFHEGDNDGNTIFHSTCITVGHLNWRLANSHYQCVSKHNVFGNRPPQQNNTQHVEHAHGRQYQITCHVDEAGASSRRAAISISSYIKTNPQSRASPCYLCHSLQADNLHRFSEALFQDCRYFDLHEQGSERVDPTELFNLLLWSQTDIDAYDANGRTLLMNLIRGFYHRWPCLRNQEDNSTYAEYCIGKLLERGVDINRRDRSGNVALHYAINYCAPNIVRKLVDAKASVNACNDRGVSILLLLHMKWMQRKHKSLVRVQFEKCLSICMSQKAVLFPPAEWQWMTTEAVEEDRKNWI